MNASTIVEGKSTAYDQWIDSEPIVLIAEDVEETRSLDHLLSFSTSDGHILRALKLLGLYAVMPGTNVVDQDADRLDFKRQYQSPTRRLPGFVILHPPRAFQPKHS
jgi:hypothetical protein